MKLTYDHIMRIPALTGTEVVLYVTPCPKPRMTQRDKWKKRPATTSYHAFKDAMRQAWPINITFPSDVVIVRFNMPMPQSWSQAKKDRMVGQGHTQKPDVDNLVKALMDAMMVEDECVTTVMAEKRWAKKGSIQIVVYLEASREAA